uniref:Uncharacterized protein n=1 Tax=Glossina pallidipes TaxID=7398 RepID=A0A1A9ZD33_GLOPL
MSSYSTLSSTNFENDVNITTKSGKLYRMLKYWRNTSKIPSLKKSASFIEYRKASTNIIYQRLESCDETKLERLRRKGHLIKFYSKLHHRETRSLLGAKYSTKAVAISK